MQEACCVAIVLQILRTIVRIAIYFRIVPKTILSIIALRESVFRSRLNMTNEKVGEVN